MTTSSRSSPECTPLDESDEARSGGEVEHSVDSERVGVNASWGTPESARRKQRGVMVDDALICSNDEKIVDI